MKSTGTIIFFIFFYCHTFAQQNINGSFVFKGYTRTYILHIPPTYDGTAQVPLLLNLHGYGSTATQQQFYAMFDNISDTANFLVAYPDAVNSVWDTVFNNSSIDDVGFLYALIDTVSKNFLVDSIRIYSTGLSMGGFMTYRLGCELSNKIAAIASVAGPMIPPFFPEYDITPPIPVLHIHGTADSTILYDGGGTWPPVDSTIQYFINKNNCNTTADTINFPDINSSDSSTASKYHFDFCDDSTEVIFYKIINGGHTWPGGLINIPNLGNTNRDMNASAEIWNFFRRHKLNPNATSTDNSVFDNELFVFPNPNQGKFEVHFSTRYTLDANCELRIYNILGEVVYANSPFQINSISNFQIDLSGKPKGIYFVKISDGENSLGVQKITIE